MITATSGHSASFHVGIGGVSEHDGRRTGSGLPYRREWGREIGRTAPRIHQLELDARGAKPKLPQNEDNQQTAYNLAERLGTGGSGTRSFALPGVPPSRVLPERFLRANETAVRTTRTAAAAEFLVHVRAPDNIARSACDLARRSLGQWVICGVVIWPFPNTSIPKFALLDLRPGPPTVL